MYFTPGVRDSSAGAGTDGRWRARRDRRESGVAESSSQLVGTPGGHRAQAAGHRCDARSHAGSQGLRTLSLQLGVPETGVTECRRDGRLRAAV
jgi:hypothetical protein